MLKKLYMKCTNDIYELPIAVADSPTELGMMVGMSMARVCQYISRNNKGKVYRLLVDFTEDELKELEEDDRQECAN